MSPMGGGDVIRVREVPAGPHRYRLLALVGMSHPADLPGPVKGSGLFLELADEAHTFIHVYEPVPGQPSQVFERGASQAKGGLGDGLGGGLSEDEIGRLRGNCSSHVGFLGGHPFSPSD